ncbi:MAG: hypothetical protein M3P82_06740, partial [Bacteroidota bacterium]|nr:hypothetical protein [Bacteroidota bacterium]
SAEDILHGDVGLGSQSRGLFITKDFSPRRYSASHEIGHLLGLPDLGQSNKSIMGYHSERGGPKASDRQEVLRNANLDFAIIGPQRIGGNER